MSAIGAMSLLLTLMPVLAVLAAAPANSIQDQVSSGAAVVTGHNMAAASPEASVMGAALTAPSLPTSPQMSQLNMMGGLTEALADVIKGAMTSGGGMSGLSGLSSIFGGRKLGQATPSTGIPRAAVPAGFGGFPMGMMNPMSTMNPMSRMFGQRGSPFGMMVPGMMMNMMENMIEMFSF